MFTCPVCGYDKLRRPADDYTICPSCGTEFGYDDAKVSHAQLRCEWLANGAQWQSGATPMPPQWNPYQQLWRAGFLEVGRLGNPFVNIVDFGQQQVQVNEKATLYTRLIAIGEASKDLLGRVHYAAV